MYKDISNQVNIPVQEVEAICLEIFKNKIIFNICQDCGDFLLKLRVNDNRRFGNVPHWSTGQCDYCKETKFITDTRHFGYPRVDNEFLKQKILNKIDKKIKNNPNFL